MRAAVLALVALGAQGAPARAAAAATAAKPPAAKAPAAKQATGAPAAAGDLDALLARFAASPGIFARFREEKHMAMLEAPLTNDGTIHFAPPSRLARHTLHPLVSSLLIDGSKLQFGDAEGRQSVDLAANPVARLFVESFVMLLSGNRAGLERTFTMRFSPRGAGGAWQLALTPRIAPMDKVIKELSLRGSGLAIQDMEVRETSGDWTRTTFSDVDVNHAYSPAEQAKVFRLPGK